MIEVAAREYNAYVRIKGLSSKLNPVDANGKLVPKAKKSRRSRFRGVAWVARRGKWYARYTDVSTPAKRVDVGYFSDDEVAASAAAQQMKTLPLPSASSPGPSIGRNVSTSPAAEMRRTRELPVSDTKQ